MDFGTIGGIVFAIGMILVGQAIEGGHVSSILQLTAAMIVFGGTIGAVMVSFPIKEFFRGIKMGAGALTQKKSDLQQILDQIVDLAGVARRDGVLALEQRLPELKDPFLKRAVGFIVDGVDATVARDSLETEIVREFEEATVGAKVFEAMGGYAPTVGILGAVLGLIHVMENLNDPSKQASTRACCAKSCLPTPVFTVPRNLRKSEPWPSAKYTRNTRITSDGSSPTQTSSRCYSPSLLSFTRPAELTTSE